jgi:ribosomal protein L32
VAWTAKWCGSVEEVRQLVNWLTHAKNAVRMDAEIGLKAVEHLLGMFTATRLRMGWTNHRCQECGSYELVARVCRQCEWADPFYEVPKMRERSNEELERRLAEPCTPSSDISTLMGLEDFRQESHRDEPRMPTLRKELPGDIVGL